MRQAKHIVNQLEKEKKGYYTILWLTDIICVTAEHIAKNILAFIMSHMV